MPNILLIEGRNAITYRTLYGVPVCQNSVPASLKATDSNGYVYGRENYGTCIVPKASDNPVSSTSYEWQIPTVSEQEDIMMSVKGSAGRVIRTYTFGFGPHQHIISPRVYYEPAMVAMDTALFLARKHGIRLIIPIINNHNGDDNTGSTGFGDYISMTSNRGLPPSQFYSSSVVQQDFLDLMWDMLHRKNTLNGIM